jgi:hypothetical protein
MPPVAAYLAPGTLLLPVAAIAAAGGLLLAVATTVASAVPAIGLAVVAPSIGARRPLLVGALRGARASSGATPP